MGLVRDAGSIERAIMIEDRHAMFRPEILWLVHADRLTVSGAA